MVEATMLLYKKIIATGLQYTHIILLSADTMPVKTTPYIADYLNAHTGISFLENEPAGEVTLERRRLFWYSPDFKKEIKGIKRLWYPFSIIRGIQRKFKLYRSTKGFERTGSQWTILAMQHVEHLLNNCKISAYRTVGVPDEAFVQDHFFNNKIPYRDTLIFANWGTPRSYSPELIDAHKYRELLNSPYLFARKFKAGTNYEAEACDKDKASSR
jgi:hypothetical protein